MFETSAERDFAVREAEYFKWLSKRPVCDGCGERITDDIYFEIDDQCLCEDCFHDHVDANYKHFIED